MATSLDVSAPTVAAQASAASGLPVGFTQALITNEFTDAQRSANLNPFALTQGWLQQVGLGGIVTGLWNSVGVAITNDLPNAIKAWAQGLDQFSNYAQFRADKASGNASAYQLALDLQKAGYAGDSSTYANQIANLYQQITGQSGYAPMQAQAQTTVQPPITPNPSGSPPGGTGASPSASGGALSFGGGLLHLLAGAGLLLLAIVLLILGIYLIARPPLTPIGAVGKAAGAAARAA